MKVIKYFLSTLILVSVFACSTDESKTYDPNRLGEFVRFNLQVDNSNNVIEAPIVDISTTSTDFYEKDNITTLKIPVALTADIDEDVFVSFSTETTNINNIDIFPSSELVFNPTKLVDTIYVNVNELWDDTMNPQLKLKLETVSDNTIEIGGPNNNINKELTINFIETNLSYILISPTNTEVVGLLDEEVEIEFNFPNGYFEEDLLNQELLQESFSNFQYELTQQPLINSNSVTYKFKILQQINVNEIEFSTVFDILDLEGYENNSSASVTILKPSFNEETPRDKETNTANNFYNLDNPFYRTFGENWMDSNSDGICSWQAFNAFTYPVVVNSEHPFAVQYSGQDTPNDTTDDVYHHAFRVGFNSPNAGNTTNAFNLKRWFNNESINASNSPGFNIIQALEFFPENGNSTTNGFVQVIAQDILISGTNGNSYTIAIEGEGSYQEISEGQFEMILELRATNNQLFGGTRVSKYYIYNDSNFEEPDPLTEDCFAPINL